MKAFWAKKASLVCDPEAAKQKLVDVLDAFADVQQEQFKCLTTGKLKRLMAWRNNREHIFNNLQKNLELAQSNFDISKDADLLNFLLERIKLLLDGEQALDDAVRRHRQVLEEKLGSMRKGKKALHGYSLHNGLPPRPKFLSSKM